MKTFITSLSNTYKALRLLSNPQVSGYIEEVLSRSNTVATNISGLGKQDAFFHKHYTVQVVH